MVRMDPAHCHLSKDHHDLLPFWDDALSSVRKSKGPGFNHSNLLADMWNKHEAMIPELSKLYQLEIKEREDSIQKSCTKKISDKKEERKKERKSSGIY